MRKRSQRSFQRKKGKKTTIFQGKTMISGGKTNTFLLTKPVVFLFFFHLLKEI